jgi:hypothetical protein
MDCVVHLQDLTINRFALRMTAWKLNNFNKYLYMIFLKLGLKM